MRQSLQICSSQSVPGEDVLTISSQVFKALHPIEQVMARALERVGKVRIEKDDITSR